MTINSAAPNIFPGPLRAKPEYFLAGKGRYGVYYLVDNLLRCLMWGEGTSGGAMNLEVDTNGTLKLKRSWSDGDRLFPGLVGETAPPGIESLAAHHFGRCFGAIQSGKHQRLDPHESNPYTAIFLALAIAFSSKASLTIGERSGTVTQRYEDGNPIEGIRRTGGSTRLVELQLNLDSKLLEEEIRAYPFRVRLPELACLAPGIDVELKYKGFKPIRHRAEHGMLDLLDIIVGEGEFLHDEPFCFDYSEDGLSFQLALRLISSEMERIKSFAGFDESYHGGVHDSMVRDVLTDVLRRLSKFEFPERRQSHDNVASSRMTYFGAYGATVPYRRESRTTEFVRILPGVAAAFQVRSPDLAWESSFRARLTGPDLTAKVQPELVVEFRRWLLERPELVTAWQKQWAPKKRKRRAPSSSSSSNSDADTATSSEKTQEAED